MVLLQKWIDAFYDIGQAWITGIKNKFARNLIDDMKVEIALTSLHEEEYDTKEVQEIVKKIKEEWSNSPETPSQFAESLMSVMKGQLAKLQLQNMVSVDLDKDAPVSKAMFGQLGIITDLSLLASTLSVIGEIVSIGQIDMLGQEIRSYLDYSGLSQITGFGYGMILSNAVSPLMTQEINKQVRPGVIDPDRALNMLYREIIDIGTYNDNMGKLGFTGDQIAAYNEAYKYYPGPTDFIRFAVRDVFNTSVVDKWGYDTDFPVGMSEHVAKAGMSMDILKWYWRAHWELPSPRTGYEMLHRGQIDQEELRELLRISDYAPGYIDKMIAISYTPYTRVDARRMYTTGVLSEDDFLTAYESIGYTKEMAENILEWAKIQNLGGEKDLTKSIIINAYNMGLIDRSVTLEYVQGLGYDPDESELIMSLEDNKREQKEIELNLKTLRVQYARDTITSYYFSQEVNKLGLSEAQAQRELIKAELEKERRIKLPSKSDLDGWMKNELITETDYRVKMKALGYQDPDIELYIQGVSVS